MIEVELVEVNELLVFDLKTCSCSEVICTGNVIFILAGYICCHRKSAVLMEHYWSHVREVLLHMALLIFLFKKKKLTYPIPCEWLRNYCIVGVAAVPKLKQWSLCGMNIITWSWRVSTLPSTWFSIPGFWRWRWT